MKKSLLTSEWILSSSLILLLFSLFTITKFHEHRKNSQLKTLVAKEANSIEVSLFGEVAKPGKYRVAPGSRLGDIVKKCKPNRFADLRSIDLDSPVETSLELEIAPLLEIAVQIEGAVIEPIELTLKPGSRICDLKSKIQLSPDADRKFLTRRRLLKDGEILTIPAKKLEAIEASQ